MPTLLIDNGHDRFGGTFHGPLLIGRRAANAIIVDELGVDLVHAWISSGESGYFIANIATGGRQTFVNGQSVQGRRVLHDGDVIEIGSSTRMTFHHHETLPGGYRPVELLWRGTPVPNVDEPIVFPCTCGATIHMTPIFSGTMSRCPQCGRVVDVPHQSTPAASDTDAKTPAASIEAEPVAPPAAVPPPLPVGYQEHVAQLPSGGEASTSAVTAPSQPETAVPQPSQVGTALAADSVQVDVQPDVQSDAQSDAVQADSVHAAAEAAPTPIATSESSALEVAVPSPASEPAPAARPTCGICHSEIEESEETAHCPDCGLVFHFDCWMGNWGCSSYGCSQVNAARPAETHSVTTVATPVADAPAAETADNLLTSELPPPPPSAPPAPTPVVATTANPPSAVAPAATPPSAPAVVATTPDLDALLKDTDAFPWEFVTLGASVIALLISSLTFGVPSLIVGVIAMLMARRRAIARPGVLFACAFLVALGLLLGLAVSSFWWLGSGPLGGRR